MAVVEPRGDSVTLVAVSAAAAEAGVYPGMTATAARSLVPSLALMEQDLEAERADFEALAAALGRFSPHVHMDFPGALLLDISGCERLFGSEPALAAQTCAAIERLGYTVRPGLADNVTAAYTLALGGVQELDLAPVEALRLVQTDLDYLAALGVRSVGDLRALPPTGLPARFSEVLTARLSALRGEREETFEHFSPPAIIAERLAFEGPTDRYDALVFALRRLAVALEERLAALEAGASTLEVKLNATDGLPVSLTLNLSRPTRQSSSLANLLLGRLESTDLGERWFDGVEACVPVTAPVRAAQRDLFQPQNQAQERALAELVDELAGRLGSGAVVRAELTADPRPERAFVYRPFGEPRAGACSTSPPRPCALFEPHEVHVECDGGGSPVLMRDGPRSTRLVSSRPERVHFGWWVGDDAERDYVAVQDDSGARWWLMARGGRWFIVGAF